LERGVLPLQRAATAIPTPHDPRTAGTNLLHASSARPLNVIYQELFNGGSYDIQPDVVPGRPFWIRDPTQPRGEVLNPAAFTIPSGANVDFPRNSLRGFPFSQTDLALRRRFNLTERLKLDVRAEYFNIFNHTMFADPYNGWGYYGSPPPYFLFGKVLPGNTLNDGLGGGLGQGHSALYAPGGPRSAQFMVKLIF
jgi:hypothetical protein